MSFGRVLAVVVALSIIPIGCPFVEGQSETAQEISRAKNALGPISSDQMTVIPYLPSETLCSAQFKLMPTLRRFTADTQQAYNRVCLALSLTIATCFIHAISSSCHAQDSLFNSGVRTFFVLDGPPLTQEEAEEFLKSAKVVGLQRISGVPLGTSLDRPPRGDTLVVLSDGRRTATAKFDYRIDASDVKFSVESDFHPGWRESIKREVADATEEAYKRNIAGYEVDKLLYLGIVTPCVERTIRDHVGSLCLWIEGSFSEYERQTSKRILPPDTGSWENQIHNLRLFIQLTNQMNYQADLNTLLIDRDWRIHKVGTSQIAFEPNRDLAVSPELTRFSKSVLMALRRLDKQSANKALKAWLSGPEISAMFSRRDAIVKLADKLVSNKGEDQVLFP